MKFKRDLASPKLWDYVKMGFVSGIMKGLTTMQVKINASPDCPAIFTFENVSQIHFKSRETLIIPPNDKQRLKKINGEPNCMWFGNEESWF